jgi:hypothetical protein
VIDADSHAGHAHGTFVAAFDADRTPKKLPESKAVTRPSGMCFGDGGWPGAHVILPVALALSQEPADPQHELHDQRDWYSDRHDDERKTEYNAYQEERVPTCANDAPDPSASDLHRRGPPTLTRVGPPPLGGELFGRSPVARRMREGFHASSVVERLRQARHRPAVEIRPPSNPPEGREKCHDREKARHREDGWYGYKPCHRDDWDGQREGLPSRGRTRIDTHVKPLWAPAEQRSWKVAALPTHFDEAGGWCKPEAQERKLSISQNQSRLAEERGAAGAVTPWR